MSETQANGKKQLIYTSRQTNSKKLSKSTASETTWTKLWKFAKTLKKPKTRQRSSFAQSISNSMDITPSPNKRICVWET
jgi:hypothetical protein